MQDSVTQTNQTNETKQPGQRLSSQLDGHAFWKKEILFGVLNNITDANWDWKRKKGKRWGNGLSLSQDNWLDSQGVRFMLLYIIGINEFATELKAKYYWVFY